MLLTAGKTAPDDAALVLEACVSAVASGNARELWKLQPNGQLVNVASGRCAGLQNNDASNGGHVVLMDCDAALKSEDGRSQWEVLGEGQLRLARQGRYCLSQSGPAPGRHNIAARAAARASSTASAGHGRPAISFHLIGPVAFCGTGASMAVDSNEATYWASKFDDIDKPVTLTVDLGAKSQIQEMKIDWAFPAKAFTVSVSLDGKEFTDVYSVNVNILKTSRVMIGRSAAAVKIIMREPHALYGRHESHKLYGIKSIALFANQLATIVEECGTAARSNDARDKYFLSRVSDFDPASGRALDSELPTLEVGMCRPLISMDAVQSDACADSQSRACWNSKRTDRNSAATPHLPIRSKLYERSKRGKLHESRQAFNMAFDLWVKFGNAVLALAGRTRAAASGCALCRCICTRASGSVPAS